MAGSGRAGSSAHLDHELPAGAAGAALSPRKSSLKVTGYIVRRCPLAKRREAPTRVVTGSRCPQRSSDSSELTARPSGGSGSGAPPKKRVQIKEISV